MKWLDRLLGEPPEPRGLYVMPGIPRPVPSRGGYPADADGPTADELPAPPASVTVPPEMAEGRRGTHVFPEVGLPEGFQPPPSVPSLDAPPVAPRPAFEYSTFPAASLASMTAEFLLNSKAAEGWRFVVFDGENYIFERRQP